MFYTTVEFPGDVLADMAMPQNTEYHFVSSVFLDGIINYVKILDWFAIPTYSKEEPVEDYLDNIHNSIKSNFHTELFSLDQHCNFVLLGETENSYWGFYYDRDVSDCCIGRVDKDNKSFMQFSDWYIKSTNSKDYKKIRLAPKGWISG